MLVARLGHTLSLLSSGQVLVVGGLGLGGYVSASELLNPDQDYASTPAGTLETPRVLHTATVLNAGQQVLVSGGFGRAGPLSSAELYGTASGQWHSTVEMNMPRALHTDTPLTPFQVLVTGGLGPRGSVRDGGAV